MFKKADASRTRHEFWITFGKYMAPVPSASEEKVNWINYRTGIKDLYFRMDADASGASICISIEHADAIMRKLHFEKFEEHKTMLKQALGEKWTWQPEVIIGDSKVVSRICKELKGKSILRKEEWPDLISFFKPRLIALDEFWSNAQYAFHDIG